MRAWVVCGLSCVVLFACASLKEASPSSDGGDTAIEGGTRNDDGSVVDGDDDDDVVGPTTDAGTDAKDAGPTKGPTGLDPGLPIPDLDGATCTMPGNPSECGGLYACRFATPDNGICENCAPQGSCSTLIGKACTKQIDCDVDLVCYLGKCELTCRFPYQGECGGTTKCIDVGYKGNVGVCEKAF